MNRRVSLWFVALALVAAQTLGLLHRIAHAPSTFTASAQTLHSPQEARGWTQQLFAGHDGDPACRLFDQLNASGVLPDVPALALPAALPLYFVSWFQVEALARWVTLFDARGPPAPR